MHLSRLQIATTACKSNNPHHDASDNSKELMKADGNADSVVRKKITILAPSSKITWHALFVETIVSKEGNLEAGQTFQMIPSIMFLNHANRNAAHRQCARDAKSLSTDEGKRINRITCFDPH